MPILPLIFSFLDLSEELGQVIGRYTGFEGLLVHVVLVLDAQEFTEHPVADGARSLRRRRSLAVPGYSAGRMGDTASK